MKIRIKADLRCPAHPRYDPGRDGPGRIRGACPVCTAMLQAELARRELERRIAECRELVAVDANPWVARARLAVSR